MKDYRVECDYCEESDIGLINRTVVVTVRADDKFNAIRKAKGIVPSTVTWRFRFEGLSYADCQELYELNVLDPEERQNDAPPVREIVEFIRRHPNFTAHGYSVSSGKDDYRVSLDGVECSGEYSLSDIQDFFSTFQRPDTLVVTEDYAYCWFD